MNTTFSINYLYCKNIYIISFKKNCPKTCGTPNNCFQDNTDYYGSDVKNGQTRANNAQECQTKCQENDACQYFSYDTGGGKKCWLKTKKTDNIKTDNKRISGPKFCNTTGMRLSPAEICTHK